MATPLALVWDLIARDNASATFAKVGASAEKASAQTETVGRKLSGVAKGLGALAVVDAGYHMVKMAADFQQSTNVLVTAAGETQSNLGLIRKGILSIATDTGTDWKQVTDGMYLLEKAGYRGADALKVERAAAQGAREEGASLATVTQAMTSIMASYHLKASDSVMVMNELKTAAGESKTTMESFAGSLSTVLPIASANKVSFADVAGSLASLTQHGTSADEATQELSNTIRNLAAPNGVAVKEMAQLGLSSVDVSQKLGDGPGGRGLAGTLNYLSQTVLQKMGPAGTVLLNTFNQSKVATQDAATMFAALPPAVQKIAQSYQDGTISLKDWRTSLKGLPADQAALASQWKSTEDSAKGFQSTLKTGLSQNQTYTDAMKKMTGGANGLNTALQLTGDSMGGTNQRIATIADSAKNAGANVDGWQSTQKLFNVQFDRFKQSAEAAGINLGTKLLPALTDIAKFVSNHQGLVEGFVVAFAGLATAIGAIKLAHEAWDAATTVSAGVQKIFGKTVRSELDKTIVKEGELAAAAKIADDEVNGGTGGVGGKVGGAVKSAAEGAVTKTGLAAVASKVGLGGTMGVAVTAPLILSGDQNQLQKWQTAMDNLAQSFPNVRKLGLDAFGALDTALVKGKITHQEFIDAVKAGNIQVANDEAKTRLLAAAQDAQRQKAKSAADSQWLLNNILGKTPASKMTNVGVPGAGQAYSSIQLLNMELARVPKKANVQVFADVSSAQLAVQTLVKQIDGTVAYVQVQHMGGAGPSGGRASLDSAHARGGYLGQGWNLVGEQGPELISPTGQVYPARDTAKMRGSGMNITQNFYQQPSQEMRQLATDSSRRIAMAMK